MAKLYFKGPEVTQHQELDKELLKLVEQGMTQREKQGSFRSFYDLEIMGITVYYKKNWRYEGLSQEEAKSAAVNS
ncbi:hypothetical protein ACFL6S_17430 [Candidatus Poribacteria bacterium]